MKVFVKGNELWKRRKKHGRDYIFATPEAMWEAACQYFDWCVKNPWYKTEQIKDAGRAVYDPNEGKWKQPERLLQIPVARPFTMQGLCEFLDCNSVYFNQFEKSLQGKEDERSKDFSQIVLRIRETIFRQKFEGAAVGVFNSSIIARELGLADKQENETKLGGIAGDDVPIKLTLNL